MTKPTNCTELRTFIGTVNYLGKFIPHLLETLLPLTSLLCKDVSWTSFSAQQDAFEKAKDLVTTAPTLAFYNPEKELILECDASECGLGAALFQGGRPMAFASRTLSDPERRYAQIEKEMLAVGYGLTRFHHYTYGQDVRVISDHKPLESIVKKPLAKAPRRIQNRLLQAQYYSYSLEYRAGKDIPVADTLSRAPIQDKQNIGNKIFHMFYTPLSCDRLRQVRAATSADAECVELKNTIFTGWPQSKQEVQRARVLASPKFLPTDSDLCSSRIRRTDRNHRKRLSCILYIYIIVCICQKCKWSDLVENRDSLLPGMIFIFYFEKKNTKKHSFCTKIAAIESTSFTVECRKSFWPYMKRMVNKQKGKNKAKTLNVWEWEHAPPQE